MRRPQRTPWKKPVGGRGHLHVGCPGRDMEVTPAKIILTLCREVYQEMEQGLEILGATAIEDKLQVGPPAPSRIQENVIE